jgi:hypothetical protein
VEWEPAAASQVSEMETIQDAIYDCAVKEISRIPSFKSLYKNPIIICGVEVVIVSGGS